MPGPQYVNVQRQIMAQVLNDDIEMREIARRFMMLAMHEVVDQLTRGDQATRASIARSLASTFTAALKDSDDGDMDVLIPAGRILPIGGG